MMIDPDYWTRRACYKNRVLERRWRTYMGAWGLGGLIAGLVCGVGFAATIGWTEGSVWTALLWWSTIWVAWVSASFLWAVVAFWMARND